MLNLYLLRSGEKACFWIEDDIIEVSHGVIDDPSDVSFDVIEHFAHETCAALDKYTLRGCQLFEKILPKEENPDHYIFDWDGLKQKHFFNQEL